eukprot:CAMPEP_0184692952 /NCGR_PEP_ID=MMETSP0313-20130426/1276_1 /TAXON_ID=2792 /ORGANISM="Porphyridium aerugineum, Strain SAG 1380-2" /LENGTH=149 /DNA_ID=CAMNT_0027150881 /DNA_START=50 /DNA_END=499 /DNA_ORIENTATION=+
MGGCFSATAQTRPDEVPFDGHIKPVEAWKVEPAITTEQLTRLRNEFWETRVEGKQEIWLAIRAAAEADTDELRDEIMKAAGIRPASSKGTLHTTYDELGGLYEVPMFCLREPENLNVEPTCPEFKDAALVVQEYCEKMKERNKLQQARR